MSTMPSSPLASIPEALTILSISRPTFYRLLRAGKLTARKMGGRTFVLRADLDRFIANLPTIDLGQQAA